MSIFQLLECPFQLSSLEMGVLLSGPHEVVFEHRRVSDSCVKQVCLQARQEGVKSNFIGGNHAVGQNC